MIFYGKINYFMAIACLKKALYLDPFDYKINFNLGTILISYNINYLKFILNFKIYIIFKLLRIL